MPLDGVANYYDRCRALEVELRHAASENIFPKMGSLASTELDALLPIELISTDEVARKYRKLPKIGGGSMDFDERKTPYVKDIHAALDDPTKRIILVQGNARGVKALALDTPLPTPSGWTTMGDVQEGDWLLGVDGRPCRVVSTTQVQFGRECFEVKFSDGSSIVADADHLWEVQTVRRLKSERRNELASKVLRTKDMLGSVLKGTSGRKRFRVALAKALQLPEKNLPLDPYVLGAWLGDGSSDAGVMHVHESDYEIIRNMEIDGLRAEVRHRTPSGTLRVGLISSNYVPGQCPRGHDTSDEYVNHRASGRPCKTCRTCSKQKHRQRYHGEPRDPVVRHKSLGQLIADAGVRGNKHIPSAYLRASCSQRLALLQGLMDTDGTIRQSGSATFTSTNERLARQTFELVASLGLKPTLRAQPAFCNKHGVRIASTLAWRVSFTADADVPVFRLRRKLARQRPASEGKQADCLSRRIVSISPVPSVPVRCIQVDGARHLYLAGRAMIPTHNTTAAENKLLKIAKYGPAQNVLWYMHSEPDLRRYVEERVEFFFEEHDLTHKITGRGGRAKWNLKKVDGMTWEWLAANASTTRGRSAAFIVGDEVDAMRPNIAAALITLFRNRQREYGNLAKAYLASHPDRGRDAGIAKLIEDSDRRMRYWTCPDCACLISPCKEAPKERRAKWNVLDLMDQAGDNMERDDLLDFVEHNVFIICPHCRHKISNEERLQLERDTGQWIGKGQEIDRFENVTGHLIRSDTAGFIIHAFMTPFITLGGLAREWVIALLDFQDGGDDAKLKEENVKSLGEVHEKPDDSAAKLRDWKETKAAHVDTGYLMKTVPRGVDFLTAMADVQGNRFEIGVWGWSRNRECWLIDRYAIKQKPGLIDIDPSNNLDDWDVLKGVLDSTYPLQSDPSQHLMIAKMGVDTGGEEGVSNNAKTWGSNLLASGECESWRLMLSKGDRHVLGDLYGKPNKITEDDGGRPLPVPVVLRIVNVSAVKRVLARRLDVANPGSGFIHLPKDIEDKYVRELISEREINGEWVRKGNNETWDTLVMSEVARALLAPQNTAIDWVNSPPPWAVPFDPSQIARNDATKSRNDDFFDRLRRLNKGET